MDWVTSFYLEMHVVGLGVLGTLTWSFSVIFFQDKAKVPLLAGHPCPVFIPLVVPYAHREVWSPDTPPPAPLRPEVSSLSEHAFPCSKQAGRQQALSRLSDRGAERPRRKGVQPVGCKALVGTAEVLPPDRLSSYTWQVLETQKGELLSRLPTMSVFLPPHLLVFILFFCDTNYKNQ